MHVLVAMLSINTSINLRKANTALPVAILKIYRARIFLSYKEQAVVLPIELLALSYCI